MYQFVALLLKIHANIHIFFGIYVRIIHISSTAKVAICKIQPECKAVSP